MENEKKKLTGRAIGAKARSDKLSPEQRSEIARNAAIKRHTKLIATHKGNFKDDFGIDVECYVLNDENKTAVITQTGMGSILGLGEGGSRLPRFVFNQTMDKYVGPELRKKIENPLVFQVVVGRPNMVNPAKANGFDATVLIDICTAVQHAVSDGKIKRDSKVSVQANIILAALGKLAIQELVYRLAGFDSTKEHFIQAFNRFVDEEVKKYEKEFPVELYYEWARLYQIEIPDRGWPWEFMHFTNKHVYYPLAKSNGKILKLLRALKQQGGDRKVKLFQFLNEIGTRALRMQLGRVLEMAESSKNKDEYEAKIVERFGGQPRFDFNEAS